MSGLRGDARQRPSPPEPPQSGSNGREPTTTGHGVLRVCLNPRPLPPNPTSTPPPPPTPPPPSAAARARRPRRARGVVARHSPSSPGAPRRPPGEGGGLVLLLLQQLLQIRDGRLRRLHWLHLPFSLDTAAAVSTSRRTFASSLANAVLAHAPAAVPRPQCRRPLELRGIFSGFVRLHRLGLDGSLCRRRLLARAALGSHSSASAFRYSTSYAVSSCRAAARPCGRAEGM